MVSYDMDQEVRPRHWRNRGQPGEIVFVTTTALDHAPIFARAAIRTCMMESLILDHHNNGVVLHAFVVMRTHIHFVSKLSNRLPVTEFVRRVKRNSSKMILSLLTRHELDGLADQVGLNQRAMWQRSFRSKTVVDESMFWDDVNYVHMNPVKAGLCQEPYEYQWSSAKYLAEAVWHEVEGLPLERLLVDLSGR